jgi:Rps23 Pro-64 3,4-dihydroxylase Tpa1-like proline 4-hydroxylase
MSVFANNQNMHHYPVKHVVMDEFVPVEVVKRCQADIARDRGKWVAYNNDSEKKITCNDASAFSGDIASILELMQSRAFVSNLSQLFEISPLQSDPLLHGGGIHISEKGGLLNIHLDYSKHPRLPLLERRINCILYLVPEWQELWGGATVLTEPDGMTVISRIYPAPGRLLIFETNDLSYHGVEPVSCPDGTERITLATYYLSHIRPGVTRERALFVPNRSNGGVPAEVA